MIWRRTGVSGHSMGPGRVGSKLFHLIGDSRAVGIKHVALSNGATDIGIRGNEFMLGVDTVGGPLIAGRTATTVIAGTTRRLPSRHSLAGIRPISPPTLKLSLSGDDSVTSFSVPVRTALPSRI
jgi:hypothetical protein